MLSDCSIILCIAHINMVRNTGEIMREKPKLTQCAYDYPPCFVLPQPCLSLSRFDMHLLQCLQTGITIYLECISLACLNSLPRFVKDFFFKCLFSINTFSAYVIQSAPLSPNLSTHFFALYFLRKLYNHLTCYVFYLFISQLFILLH